MDSEPAEEQTCTEEVSKSVEVVVETEAEAGASGYSVTGGGQHGIFVKDVLKDSPAAKHLSLQQGDQLLSAKVYFDNVRYEDALKILQCAEPYKVSFQVKRTVPKAEVSVRPKVPSGELKGPKAKLAKMSVKGMKSFKTQKKRGGRFGLKRLKEKRREELVIEGTPPRLEAGDVDVDVEFSLPKLKHRKSATSDVEVRGTGNVGKTKSHIRFPHMKTKGYSAAAGQLEFEGHENIPPTEIPGAKVKTKGKGHKFGIVFPKTKHAKSGSGSLDVRPPEISLQPPSVEVSLSGKEDKNVAKRGSKFNPPDVEFALPSGKVEASLPTVRGTTEIKAPKVDVRGAADVPQGKVNVDVGKEDAKLRLPKLKLPKIRLSRHSDEIDGDIKVKAKGMEMPHPDINSPTAEIRGGGEIRLPGVEVTKPNIKGDISGKAASVQMPSVDISLPNVKGKSDGSYSLQGLEGAGKSEINMPAVNISVPDAVLPSDSGRRIPDEVEGTVKGPKISVPRVDISLPKTGAPGVDIEGLGGGGKFNPPSVGISSPKIKSDGVDVHMDHYVGGDGKFKLPDFDVTLPKMKSPEEDVEVGYKLPKMDPTLPKSNVVATDKEGKGTFQLPSVDVSLPKLKAGQVEVDAKGQTAKGGKFEMSVKPLPKGKMEGDIDVKGCVEGDKFKMPSIDVSLPKLGPEGHIKAPKLEVESDIPVPSVNISMPKGKADGDVEIGDLEAKGGKFKVPSVNIKLPKMESAGAKADIQGPEIKGQKKKAPSAPKGELDIEGRGKGGKFSMPSVNISLPKTKLPEGDVKVEAPELPNIDLSVPTSSKEANVELEGNAGAKFKMPNFDISFPKGQAQVKGGDIKEPTVKEGAKFNIPSLDISLPTIQSPEKGTDISFEGPEINIKSPKANLELKGTEIKGGKLNLPTKDVSLPKEKADVKINVEGKGGKLKMPSFDMSLPKVKMPEESIEIEGQPVDISLPKGKLDVDIGAKSKGGHFHLPSVDVSLPKIKSKRGNINIEGPELKSGEVKAPTIDICMPQGTIEGDIAFDDEEKGVGFDVPSVDIDLSSVKIPDRDVNLQGPKVKGDKFEMPRIDLSLPKGKKHGNINIDIHSGIDGNIEISSLDTKLPKGQGKSGINVKGPGGKVGKHKKPKFNISAPKLDAPDVDVKVHGPEVKGKIEMPAVDISPPKGRLEGDLDIDSHGAKGDKFHMPSLNINLPKIKSKEASVDVKGHEGQGQTFGLPSMDISAPKIKSPEVDVSLEGPDVDISLPNPKADVEMNVKNPEIEGGKTKMPTFDISMPKVNFPESEVKLKGKKIEMPDIDISLPKGKSDGEIDGHGWKGGKFHMPSVDFSLPKIKAKGPEVNIEGPELKQGNINMPDVDISLQNRNVDVDFNAESTEIKGGKFKMPKFDISLPKTNLTGGHVDAPNVNISLPKVKGDVDVEGCMDKEGRFQLPSVDVSLPKIEAKGADIHIKGPELKSDIAQPKGKVEGDLSFEGPHLKGQTINLPTGDISFSKGTTDADFDVDGKFKMPKFDLSLPKVSLPKGETKDLSIKGGKIEMPDIDISIPKGKGEIETGGHASKGSKFQMPSVDISLPKIKGKGPDLRVEIPEVQGGKENITLLDVSRPNLKSPELDVSLEGPDMNVDVLPQSLKAEGDISAEGMEGGKFKMPKFDISLPKISLPKVDSNVEGPGIKGKAKISVGDVSVAKPKGPEINFGGPKTKGGKIQMPADVDIHGPNIKGDVSLPKIKSSHIETTIKGPEIEGGKVDLQNMDVSLPKGKVEADVTVEGTEVKGGKFKMPKFDVSLPKINLPKVDVNVEGPDMKGKIEKPTTDISPPKGKATIDINAETGKGSKFHMPTVDFSLPNVKAKEAQIGIQRPDIKGDLSLPKVKGPAIDISLRGPEVEGGKIDQPNLDISYPKGKLEAGAEVEGNEVKGGKFKMPKTDLSLPMGGLPEADLKVKGPKFKTGKIELPDIDFSLPKGKVEGDIATEGHAGKGGRFHLPNIDISLPKLKAKGTDINIEGPELKGEKIKAEGPDVNVEGPEIKGGKLKMPDVDVSLPKGNVGGDFDVEAPKMKGGKFKLPKFDVSLPKVSLPKADASIEGPEMKGKVEIPAPEVSLPKAKTDVEIDVNTGTSGKFHMPSIDINLPKIKAEGPAVNVEGPEIKGGRIEMPDVDVSLPKGNVGGDFNVKGPKMKGGMFKLPKFDVSLPKVSLPKADASIEGPDMKGKVEIPAPEVSLPKAKTNVEIDVNTGTSGKFHMPSVDISLPKIKAKGDVGIQGPKIKGDFSLPKIKSPETDVSLKSPEVEGGKINLPGVDLSLPKGKVDGNYESEDFEGEKGNFKMPKIDVSLPKVSLPEGNVKGPDIKAGNIELPDIDLSLPKPNVEGDIDIKGQIKKGGKFHMPSIHFPDMKAKELQANIKSTEADVDIKGPHVKGGKGGKFHMPTLDVNMPRFDLDLSLPSVSKDKGLKVEVSGPDASGDLEMLGLQGDIKPDQLKVKTGDLEGPGASLKLPSVKLPTVDISAPKLDLDFGLNKPQSDDVELLKAEGGRPSSGGSFDLPNVSLKAPSFTFPRFGSKSKSGDLEASGLQADISLHPPNVEGEIRAPSVEFDGDGKVKMKKHKIKMPSFGISKKDTDVSVSCPDVDVKMKKGKPDFPHLDFTTDNPDNKAKHKIKFPKFKMSSPKVHLPEGEVDAKVEADMDRKSGFHAPDVTLKFPKFSIPGFGSKEKDLSKPSGELQLQPKVKVPSVELSLPEAKTPEMEVLLPKAEVDVSEADIKGYEGNLKIPKMPKIDVSIPQVDLDVSLPKGKCQKIGRPDMELEGGEGKFKMPQITMPTVDVTLPKGKPKDLTKPKTEIDADGGKFTIPYVKMPTVDITLPKPDISLSKAEAPEIKIEGTTEQKFKMPRVDISLPKGKFQDNETPEMNERGKIKMPHIKMPSVNVTLPKGQIEGPDVEIRGEGGKFKMPQVSMPSVDISCSKGKAEGPNVQVEGNYGDKFKLPHCKMPDVDVSLPKGQTEAPGVEIKGEKGTYKMPQISMPSIQISLPKGKAEDLDIEGNGRERFKAPYIKMPSVDASIPKVKTNDSDAGITGNVGGKFKMPHVKVPNVEFAVLKGKENPDVEIKGEGGKFKMPHISMPSGDGSLTKVQFESPEIETGGGTEGKVNMPHLKMPNVDISLAKGNAGKFEGTAFKGEGHIPEVPSGDISLQKGKTAGPHPGIKSEGGKFKMPKVDITLPRGKPSVETPEVDIKKEGLLEMPKASTDKPIKGPREDIDVDIGFQREEGMMNKKKVVLPDLDLNTSGTETKVKRGKGKGKKFKIGVPKMKGAEDVTAEAKQCGDINVKHNDHSTGKGHINVTAPEVTLPSVCLKTDAGSKGGQSPSSYEIKVPRIPDIEFDIGTSQDEDDDKTETEKKVKIPKFGVPLPSMSSPERRVDIYGSEVRYEGPKMPKVKKAVFVLVNPNETEQVAANTALQKKETTAGNETEDVKVKMGKVKTKSNFGKSKDKSTEGEAEEEEKSKGAKIKMPKFSLSSGKSGSVDVTVKGDGSSSSLNGEKDATPHKDSKDDKGTFGGKIKLPKVEFTRPYSKMATGDKMGKDSSSGEVKGDVQGLETPDKMTSTEVVSSRARTEMLDRDSSESPAGFGTDFTSTKVHMWSEGGSRGGEAEEKESTSWFKVPKFTLKPHTTGFLQITPEGSPQAQHRGELGGEAEVSGSFCLHTSGVDFASQQMSEEHQVSSTEEGSVTTVTKTTRITSHLVTTETRTSESSSTTHQVLDFNY